MPATERVGVVGAGTMGAGIAQLACLGGYETWLHDPVPAALERGAEKLRESLRKGAERKRWSPVEAEAAATRLSPAPSLADLAECQLVIEAAPEELELKRELFASLAEACSPEAILATNTSSLPVGEIAARSPRPEWIVGMHFFNPPPLMKLVEIVSTGHAAPEALAVATTVAEGMGRVPIRARDSPGFIANRLARPFSLESLRMLAEGFAEAATIDRVVRRAGCFRMGPFELLDLIGLDINLSVARSFYRQGGEPERWRPSSLQERMVADGMLGRKSGRGFYDYGDGPPPPHASSKAPPPYVPPKERDEGARAVGPTIDPEELVEIDPAAPLIVPRLFAQIANEAAFALEEEVGSPQDMDTAMRLGFNWPLGPLQVTELIGAPRAAALLEELRGSHGEAYRPAPSLGR